MRISNSQFNIGVLILLVAIGMGVLAQSLIFSDNYLGANGKTLKKRATFREAYNKSSDEIVKLRIRSGNNGEAYETNNPEEIDEFLKLMSSTTFIKQKDQRKTAGWTYYVDLFDTHDDTNWFRISFSRVFFSIFESNRSIISSPYYVMEYNDIIMKELHDFFDSMKTNGKMVQ